MSPLDENTMRALFEELEVPATVDERWRTRAAFAALDTEPEGRIARLPEIAPRPVRPRARLAAAGVTALVAAAIAVGVVASNRLPPTDPQPDVTQTISIAPSSTGSAPSPPTDSSAPTAPVEQPQPPTGSGPGQTVGPGGQPNQPTQKPPTAIPPARGPLTDWPDETNAGVPTGTTLRSHAGDLHVTTPGAIVYDLRVDGTLFIEAPDVTLRRVLAVPSTYGGVAVRQLAPRLTIEDSEVRGELRSEASGLSVRRGDVRSLAAIARAGDASVVDTRLGTVAVTGPNARILLRHNTVDVITMDDAAGPVTDMTIDNNRLDGSRTAIWAPNRPGSRDIHIMNNKFDGASPDGRPVNGYDPQAPGNTWAGNVWLPSNEPVNP